MSLSGVDASSSWREADMESVGACDDIGRDVSDRALMAWLAAAAD